MPSISSDPSAVPSSVPSAASAGPRTSAGRRAGRAALAGAAALALGLWIAVSAFHPFTPALPQAGLDASWIAAMGEAADRPLRWGVDVAFTYGPASTLVTGYLNAAYLGLTLPLLLVTCLLFGCCTVLLAGSGAPAPARSARLWAAAATTGLVAAVSVGYPDGLFLVLPLLPFLLTLAPGRAQPLPLAAAAVTAVAVGVIGMAKMSFPLAALPLFLLGDAAAIGRRRIPVLTAACLVGFLAGDLVYGQAWADLPAFVRQQGEVVAGYSEAMALDGSRRELSAYAAATLALLALVASAEGTARPAWARPVLPLGLAWVLLVVFKAGFVRQDNHTSIAWYGLALAATVVAWARLGSRLPRAAAAVVASALVGSVMLGPWRAVPGRGGVAAALAQEAGGLASGPAEQLAAAWRLMRDPSAFAAARRAEKAERWRDLAEDAPLPRLAGGVDVIPSQQSRVIAAGLDYRPRPSFQEYSTYTAGLIAANRAFMEGPRAPDWVLFGPEYPLGRMTLDQRYPNLTEGALWLDLLRLYRPERRIGNLVALHRRASPAPVVLGEARRETVGLGEPVAVAPLPGGAGATFVRIDVHPTLLGRVANVLFRPAPLVITVRFADGRRRPYQLVSGIAAAGFVLSPLVTNATDYEMLDDGAPAPPERSVTEISVDAPPRLRGLLDPRVEVELRPVSGLADDPAPRAASAWAALSAAADAPAGATEVAAPVPSLLALPVSGIARVELGFGLALAPDAPPGEETVCFALHPADGTAAVLWQRCLGRGQEADRGPQRVSLPVPPGVSELALETSCTSGCDEGVGAYWGRP